MSAACLDKKSFTAYQHYLAGYGDEVSAAEEMAFILFQVWRFPVDWRFFVKAAAFGDKKSDWENGTPVE